ncbi:MAG: hypothetical protein LBK69_03050 [Syntrophomonadaceae bacterium]|jgi:integrase|nr:hypothetical protein [Syntrophomonadaceae bacterium]
MRGSLAHQVHELFKIIDHRGESKKEVKQAFYKKVRDDKKRVKSGEISNDERLKGTTTNLAERMGAHGYKTSDQIRDEWLRLAQYAHSISGRSINKFDISKDISNNIIKDYLSERFVGLERRTTQNIAGYITKYATAVKTYGEENRIAEIRTICAAALPPKQPKETTFKPKNHINPAKVLKALKNIADKTKNDNAYKSYIVSRVYYESGTRAAVGRLMTPTGKTQINDNVMRYKTKAGQLGSTIHGNYLSDKTIRLINDYKAAHGGVLHVDDSTYNRWLHKAEAAAGDRILGAHGWRYDRAWEFYNDCRASGMTEAEALIATGEMLDHHRPDITKHYLSHCR